MRFEIGTERLIIRNFEERDVADMVAYSSEADFWLARNLSWAPTVASITTFWATQQDLEPAADPEWQELVVERRDTGTVIGTVGIGVRKVGPHKQGIVGWAFGCEYQGQGYATEAARALITYGFYQMGLHRISARTGADNVRSWRLMERLGMRREAHFRQSHIVDDAWRDEYVYAVLADEWEAGT